MTKFPKKLEQFISISILVSSVLVSAFLIHKYLFSLPNQPESIEAINKQINVPDINWSEQPETLIIALQTGCHFALKARHFINA